MTGPLSLAPKTIMVTSNANYHNLIVRAHIPTLKAGTFSVRLANTVVDTLQVNRGDGVDLTWIVDDMKRGETFKYQISQLLKTSRKRDSITMTKSSGNDINVAIDGKPFTTYDNHTGPNKPYFYPMYSSTGKLVLRHYGVETVSGETHDHPHHRGMWFTHGDVNGQDFWSEDAKSAKTITTRIEPHNGSIAATLMTSTDWISNDGKKIATDERSATFYTIPNGRMMDVEIKMTPVGGPLTFGDTKEGSFGMRLPDSMRVVGGDGHINSDTGVKDAKTWGKKAAWVDYFGTVDGELTGIAIFDATDNLRHPSTWHVRDYGLFAVNPFGLHDFDNDKANPKKGNYTVEVGKSLSFKYRIFIHKGNTLSSHIQEVWNSYSIPPTVQIK